MGVDELDAASAHELRFAQLLDGVDRATSFVERPVRRAAGSARLNPLVHAGTISVFLLGIVVLTGLYITLFFEFGHAASYDSVAAMEEHPLQRVVRALHRYSSAALVVTTLVHGWHIFVAQRFTSRRRRWRWASGVAALTLVWISGVTGYWLVWDRRAAAISEAAAQVLKPFGVGRRFAVDHLIGFSPGNGSGFLLVIWFVHVLLTGVIAWFMYRHLRRSKQPWLPPRHWMALISLSLVLVSLVLPLGMLEPARPDRLVVDMPVDPFVLFLLPPLLSSSRWVAVVAMLLGPLAIALLPRMLRRRDPDVISIDPEACTGCELCVLDCPYDALSMDTLSMGSRRDRSIAVLDEAQCVSCGICVGSCAFDAITLPGFAGLSADILSTDTLSSNGITLEGKTVVVICDRHDPADVDGDDTYAVPVRCAGMLAPHAVRRSVEAGAAGVELVGCAPSDCRYGTGNVLAADRLAGLRAPHPPRAMADRVGAGWVYRGEVDDRRVRADGGDAATAASSVDARKPPVAAGLVVLVSIVAIVAATRAPFNAPDDSAGLRVVVDHTAGAQLVDLDAAAGAAGGVEVVDALEVRADGVQLASHNVSNDGSSSIDFADWLLPADTDEVQVIAVAGEQNVVVYDGSVAAEAGLRFVVSVIDVPEAPGRSDGQSVFTSRAAGCTVCHSVERGDDGVGPSLYGIGTSAYDRVEGLDAAGYMRQSILLPDQYVLEGWPAGQMLPIYRERLDKTELEALITYLTTLTKGET